MNFDFLKECSGGTQELQKLYESVVGELENAEHNYWNNPQKSGIILRGVAEKICRIYIFIHTYYNIKIIKNQSVNMANFIGKFCGVCTIGPPFHLFAHRDEKAGKDFHLFF